MGKTAKYQLIRLVREAELVLGCSDVHHRQTASRTVSEQCPGKEGAGVYGSHWDSRPSGHLGVSLLSGSRTAGGQSQRQMWATRPDNRRPRNISICMSDALDFIPRIRPEDAGPAHCAVSKPKGDTIKPPKGHPVHGGGGPTANSRPDTRHRIAVSSPSAHYASSAHRLRGP